MAKATPATRALDSLKVEYKLFTYDYDKNAQKIGIQAAEEIGVEPGRVLKTLMTFVDGQPVCVLIPADKEVNMKKLAAAFDGKSAKMMPAPEAEKQTGYKVGGISPLGRRKESPVAVDESAMGYDRVFLNGGQRGLQINMEPEKLVEALNAKVVSLIA